MTFSDFVQIFYNQTAHSETHAQFLIELTNKILKKSFTESTDKGKGNPLNDKTEDMLGRIFRGTKLLPRKDARIITHNLDKKRFADYLLELPIKVASLICKDMQEKGEDITDESIDLCADLFERILQDCVKGKGVSANRTKSKKTSTIERVENVGIDSQLTFSQDCRICRYCEYWKGDWQAADEHVDGVYGKCDSFGKCAKSTDGSKCDEFKPNYGDMTFYKTKTRLHKWRRDNR